MLGDRPNQLDRLREDVGVTAADLLAVAKTPGRDHRGRACATTSASALQYLAAWLGGIGAVGDPQPDGGRGHRGDLPLADLAVDPQRRHARRRPRPVTRELVERVIDEELAKIRDGSATTRSTTAGTTRRAALFKEVALADDFADFLTLPPTSACRELDGRQLDCRA